MGGLVRERLLWWLDSGLVCGVYEGPVVREEAYRYNMPVLTGTTRATRIRASPWHHREPDTVTCLQCRETCNGTYIGDRILDVLQAQLGQTWSGSDKSIIKYSYGT